MKNKRICNIKCINIMCLTARQDFIVYLCFAPTAQFGKITGKWAFFRNL